jgi:hypothetical protein
LVSASGTSISPKTGALSPAEEIYEMNCREELREHLLVERMRQWLSRARYGQEYVRRRSRKNYLSLIRTHRALAERHGLREKNLF